MKNDNSSSDHEHPDYEGVGVGNFVLTIVIGFALYVLIAITNSCQNDDIDDLTDRINQIECRDAADEAACLRDLLEDK